MIVNIHVYPPPQGEIPTLETELIASVRTRVSNAEHSFSELFSRYHHKVYWLIHRILGGQGESEDCEEIVNNVFRKIWTNIDKYDSERASFGTWVNVITASACKDFLRKRRKEKGVRHEPLEQVEERYEFPLQGKTTGINHVDTQMFADEIMEIIRQNFDEIDIVVLILRVWQEMKFREIAEVVNLPETTVKTRFRRLKQKTLQLVRESTV